MVTICVDGENKTHKITDWTLWAGNDDRGYADLSFSQREKNMLVRFLYVR